MVHHITAIVTRTIPNAEKLAFFGLPLVELRDGFVLVPLNAGHADHWHERLQLPPEVDHTERRIILDCNFTHHLATELIGNGRFALIETDYFGGSGEQSAVVYEGRECVMVTESGSIGPINRALRKLGAEGSFGRDEFETLGLHQFRKFDNVFSEFDDR